MSFSNMSGHIDALVCDAQGSTPRMQADPICAARCEARKTQGLADAARVRDAGGYFYGMMSSNCPTPWDQPRDAQIACWLTNDQCKSKCAGLWDAEYRSCLANCSNALQSCCYAVEVKNQEHAVSLCTAGCPQVSTPQSMPPSPAGELGKGATSAQKSQWTSLLSVANAALDTAGLDKIPAERVDDMLRSLAFLQVRASMLLHGSKYTVVSGGAGRIWILTSDGKQVPLSSAQSDMVRGPKSGMWQGPEYEKTLQDMTTLAGLTIEEAKDCINQVRSANQQRRFAAGEMLEFPPWQGWPQGARASAEHSSIRGTINGGGDFI